MENRTFVILAADDEEELLEALQLFLEREHMKLIKAADGPTALRLFEKEQPDLVLLDVMMPGMDGFAVLRRIREKSRIPALMMTARTELKRLLNFIDGRQPEDSFTQDLSKAVESAKRNEKWRHDYMTLQMAYDEKYREGLETGIQQGIERGIEQGITTSARRMLSSGKYSDSEISEITGLSVEQIQALKNSAK